MRTNRPIKSITTITTAAAICMLWACGSSAFAGGFFKHRRGSADRADNPHYTGFAASFGYPHVPGDEAFKNTGPTRVEPTPTVVDSPSESPRRSQQPWKHRFFWKRRRAESIADQG